MASDGIDYTRSFTARSFVPHYAQRISAACVMYGAEGILKGVRKLSHDRLRRAAVCPRERETSSGEGRGCVACVPHEADREGSGSHTIYHV